MRGWKQNSFRIVVVWLQLTGLMSLAYAQSAQTHNSVLAGGNWVKIGVTESGVYQLDRATLARLNPAFASADPRYLRLYSNGGAPLPQPNSILRPDDLSENAIQVRGESDGRFDAGDVLLFFGQSPHGVRYDSTTGRFVHQINPYSDTTFYFLTVGTTVGQRVIERPVGATTSAPTVTRFNEYRFHEVDQLKIPAVRSGREWVGEYMATDTTVNVSFDLPGMVPNSPVRLRASALAAATVPTQFRLQVAGQSVGTMSMAAISGYEYDYQGVMRTDTFLTKLASAEPPFQLALTFLNKGQRSAQGYLNFLSAEVQRELRQYNQPTWARRLPAGQYAVRQATTGLRVWNVTNPLAPAIQNYALSADQEARWSAQQSGDYFLFTDANLLAPVALVPIANQNLHGQNTPNLLIVTSGTWRVQAERLAAFRREHDRLSVLVVTTQEVYNEFGSGQPDPTAIRDMARYFYQKQPGQLRYLLLFGDATYDYRNISGLASRSEMANMVPVYESRESLHPVLSYSSDDYFGFMNAGEGEWPESSSGDAEMEIGVGRLPVKSVDEAQTVVDKLIRYGSDQSLAGDWQTQVMLIADDGDYNTHQKDADQLAVQIETTAPAYRPERLFLGSYPQDNTTGVQRAPAVNQLINRAIADGRLIINYSGHGGILDLADEQIVTLKDILSWRNRRLPLFVTATCQFGRYDDPTANSGAELALLSRLGGAVGLLTTTRPVYANTNLLLNEAFYNAVFTPINGQMPRLGDVMRLTKNNSLSGPVNRNFALLGDPSMQLAYPQAQIMLTGVNGKPVTANRLDTLKALQTVELTGEIQQQRQRLTDFSGTLRLTVYDKATTQTTLGTEADSPKMTYQAYTNTVYTGQVSVQQGRFTLRFTLPKDIDYTVGRAKVYAYAVRADSLLEALGSYDSLRIGGSVFVDSLDTEPPVVTLSVVGGVQHGEAVQVAGPDLTVHIALRDNRGINVARSGLGHELTVRLNEQPPVVLNDFYVANSPDGRQGVVTYTLRDVTPGTYRVEVKAWDINNNSTEGALTIVVSERPGLRIGVLQTRPNPVITTADLTAEQNRSGEPLDWTLGIYDLNGKLLNEQTGQCSDCPSTLALGAWDGRTNAGEPLPNGLYIVRIQLRSAADGSVANASGRIVLTK